MAIAVVAATHAAGGNPDEPTDARVAAGGGDLDIVDVVGPGWAGGDVLRRGQDDVVVQVPIHGIPLRSR